MTVSTLQRGPAPGLDDARDTTGKARAQPEPPGGTGRGRVARLFRGPADAPVWARPALLVLLAATAVLYLWGLSASGNANSFYAAAVQAGTKNWKALFFGSLDSSNFITVDKPPAALWVMGLSGRIFGFNSWSMLAPQALMGVLSVGLVHAMVRRHAGHAAALLAGAILALTPAAVLMFRFNNPDALLVLLLVVAAYATTRALEVAGTRWLVAAGIALGFAFLTKMLQGFLVVPGFALAYLVAAPTSLGRRIGQLLLGGIAMVAAAGWWIAIVQIWPASSRPYIGGSTDNTVLNLVFGYNGFGRLFGNSAGGGGGGGGGGGMGSGTTTGTSFGGATGIGRLFSSEFGNEISWLLPAALVALVAGLWVTRRAPRTDLTRAALLLWGGWLLVTGIVFAYMRGTVHPYYTVAMAPAIAALIAVGGRALWSTRDRETSRAGLAAMVAAAGGWSSVLLSRNADWHPELRWIVLALTGLLTLALALPVAWRRRTALVLVSAAMVVGLLGTSAYAVATAATPHTGSIPTAGPASAGGGGMGGGPGGSAPTGTAAAGTARTGTAQTGTAPTGTAASGSNATSTARAGQQGGGAGNSQLSALLEKTTTTWAAATTGSQSAAELELASGGQAVMAIGGWSGDPTPTLAEFQQYVADGQITYFIAGMGGGGGPGGGSSTSSAITSWVTSHFETVSVGGTTVYDLTSPTS